MNGKKVRAGIAGECAGSAEGLQAVRGQETQREIPQRLSEALHQRGGRVRVETR